MAASRPRKAVSCEAPLERGKHAGVPERPAWLPLEGPGNRHVLPEMWAMSACQFHGFIAACKATRVFQAMQLHPKDPKDQKNQKKNPGAALNMYHLADFFVKPWTAGTGNSVALLLNYQRPLAAQLMISHSWGEEIDECGEALMLHFSRYKILDDAACWFCVFSIYQPSDCLTISEQLALDPFGRVLSTITDGSDSLYHFDERGMVVIHTSTSEVYERLWCVFEIGRASLDGVSIKAACSYAYIVAQTSKSKESLRVFTENARCSVEEDESRIRQLVMSEFGGAQMLNETIWTFRMDMMRQMGYELRSGAWKAIPNMSFFRKGKNAAADLLELQAICLQKLKGDMRKIRDGYPIGTP